MYVSIVYGLMYHVQIERGKGDIDHIWIGEGQGGDFYEEFSSDIWKHIRYSAYV